MNSSTVVLVLILGCLIGIANSATITTPKTKQTTLSSNAEATITTAKVIPGTSNKTAAEVKAAANNGSFVNIEEPCRCVSIHLCDADDVVYAANSENLERCATYNVCCRMEISIEAIAPSSPVDSASSPTTSTQGINIPPPATDSSPLPPPSDPLELPSKSVDEVGLPVSSESSSSSPTQPPQVEPECGIKGKVNPKWWGGEIDLPIVDDFEYAETEFGEFPWMVALFRSNEQSNIGELICGASLLSPYIVLTAAHCVKNIDRSILRVRAGEYNIGSTDKETLPHQDRAISEVQIHPNFNAKRLHNDMALLSVTEPFHYESHVSSICAPLAGTPYIAPNSYSPKNCWATGWGKSNINDTTLQHKLKKVELPIMKREECQEKLRTTKLGKNFVVDASFICAGGIRGFDSCKADGGGPLFCASKNNDKKFIQVGITSWGVGCGGEIPAIFASLEANSEWLTTEFNAMSVFRP